MFFFSRRMVACGGAGHQRWGQGVGDWWHGVHPGGLLRAVRAHAVGMRAQWWFAPRQREKEIWGPEYDEPPLTSDTSRGFVCI